jgi:hypothetical protein
MNTYKVKRKVVVLATIEEEFKVVAKDLSSAKNLILTATNNEEYVKYPSTSELIDIAPLHKAMHANEMEAAIAPAAEINF